jgi:hypothetical protein
VRKVHHPKIVPRSDGRWIVSCQDGERQRDFSPLRASTVPLIPSRPQCASGRATVSAGALQFAESSDGFRARPRKGHSA